MHFPVDHARIKVCVRQDDRAHAVGKLAGKPVKLGFVDIGDAADELVFDACAGFVIVCVENDEFPAVLHEAEIRAVRRGDRDRRKLRESEIRGHARTRTEGMLHALGKFGLRAEGDVVVAEDMDIRMAAPHARSERAGKRGIVDFGISGIFADIAQTYGEFRALTAKIGAVILNLYEGMRKIHLPARRDGGCVNVGINFKFHSGFPFLYFSSFYHIASCL